MAGAIVSIENLLKAYLEENTMKQWESLAAVERSQDKVSGAWLFSGTRVPVAALFENVRDGATIDEFLEWFPGVQRSQVEEVLNYELSLLTEQIAA